MPLRANAGLASLGFMLNGAGFILGAAEARRLLAADPAHAEIIRPYRNGKDLAAAPARRVAHRLRAARRGRGAGVPGPVRHRARPRQAGPRRERAAAYAALLVAVRRSRGPDSARRCRAPALHRDRRDGEAPLLRLPRRGSRARPHADRLASDDPFVLGVLSSAAPTWALAAGAAASRHAGLQQGRCFDAVPFPDPPPAARRDRGRGGAHSTRTGGRRRARPDAYDDAMYNVVEKLRAGAALTATERAVHDLAACGMLRDLHDDLDRLVAEAYGWAWPEPPALVLERLVALHDGAEEEQAGTVRWLRPGVPGAAVRAAEGDAPVLDLAASGEAADGAGAAARPWPGDAIGQISAVRALAAATPVTVTEAVRQFAGAPDGTS